MTENTTNISIRMDSDLKTQADALFPFDISLNQPNKETIAAMLEAERIAKDPSVKSYTDLDELFADLKK